MNPDELTEAVSQALAEAQKVAANRKHQEITITHLFKVLVQPGELARQIFAEAGMNVDDFEKQLDQQLDEIATVDGQGVAYGQNISSSMLELLQNAEKEKTNLGDGYVAVDTLVIALMDTTGNKVVDYVKDQGITKQKIEEVVQNIRGGRKGDFKESRR